MNNAWRTTSSALVFVFLSALPIFAQSNSEFVRANQEYAAGHYKEAIAGYEAIARRGQYSGNLFYNLANAYFREKDYGDAILNYERALLLDRYHPEALANLTIARDEARALELARSAPERYLSVATAGQYAIAAAIAFWVGIFCVARMVFGRRRLAVAVSLSIVSLVIFIFTTVAAYRAQRNDETKAIVTANGVEARLATADNANSVLALPPGSEIQILTKRGDWVYAALPNALRGWIPAKSAELIRL